MNRSIAVKAVRLLQKVFCFLSAVFLLVLLPGCWGKKELNDIGIIQATGIDKETGGDIRLTVISAEPADSMPMSASEKASAWIGTATGKNIIEAFARLNALSSKSLVWFQNNLVLIGKDAAKSGIAGSMDFFARNRETRYTGKVLVVDGRAYDFLQIPADIDTSLPQHLEGIIRNIKRWSGSFAPDLKYVFESLTNSGNMVLGLLQSYSTTQARVSTYITDYAKSIGKEPGSVAPFLSETAVFKEGRMIGSLDSVETRDAILLSGNAYKADIMAPGVDGKGYVSFRADHTGIKIKPFLKNGAVAFKVKIDTRGHITELTGGDSGRMLACSRVQLLEGRLAGFLKESMCSTLHKVQNEYAADIFNFGDIVFRDMPDEWRTVGKRWGSIFPGVDVEIEVKVRIERTGEITEPVSSGRVQG